MGNGCSLEPSPCYFIIRLDFLDDKEKDVDSFPSTLVVPIPKRAFHSNRAIVAGNELRGSLRLEVNKKLPPTTKVFVRLQCNAVMTYMAKDANGDKYLKTRRHNMYEDSVLLEIPPERLIPGNYNFPFQFQLSASLPSSMYHRKLVSGESCEIEYRVQVDRDEQAQVRIRKFDVVSVQHPDEKMVIKRIDPGPQAVKSSHLLACGNKGTMSIRAEVCRHPLTKGGKFELLVECQNESTERIREILVELIEIVDWRKTIDASTISKARVSDLLCKQETLHTIRAKLTLEVPRCHDTYQGNCIAIKHILKISAAMGVGIQNAAVGMPVQICNPSAKEQSRSCNDNGTNIIAVKRSQISPIRRRCDNPPVKEKSRYNDEYDTSTVVANGSQITPTKTASTSRPAKEQSLCHDNGDTTIVGAMGSQITHTKQICGSPGHKDAPAAAPHKKKRHRIHRKEDTNAKRGSSSGKHRRRRKHRRKHQTHSKTAPSSS